MGRLAYQNNSTFQSFICLFVDFSRLCTEHCLRGRLCQSVALQKVLAARKRVSTEQPITDYLSPSVMPPLPSQANMDSSCFARLAQSTKLQHFEERERKSTFSQHSLTRWRKRELRICNFYCGKIECVVRNWFFKSLITGSVIAFGSVWGSIGSAAQYCCTTQRSRLFCAESPSLANSGFQLVATMFNSARLNSFF